jgi:DNA polymerase-3 subunit epsilon
MIDTLVMAKARFPGMPNSLDALCRRFEVDLSARTTHNALLDCKLLAEVYVELTGGRQRGLTLETEQALSFAQYEAPGSHTARLVVPSAEQLAAHAEFVAKLKEPVWRKE